MAPYSHDFCSGLPIYNRDRIAVRSRKGYAGVTVEVWTCSSDSQRTDYPDIRCNWPCPQCIEKCHTTFARTARGGYVRGAFKRSHFPLFQKVVVFYYARALGPGTRRRQDLFSSDGTLLFLITFTRFDIYIPVTLYRISNTSKTSVLSYPLSLIHPCETVIAPKKRGSSSFCKVI